MRNYITPILLVFLSVQSIFAQEIADQYAIKVKFKPEYAPTIATSMTIDAQSGVVQTGIASLDECNEVCSAIEFSRLFADGGKYRERREAYGLHLWYEIKFSEDKIPEIMEIVRTYSQDSTVQIAEPFYAKSFEISGAPYGPVATPLATVDDPRFDEQWHYNNTGQTGGKSNADVNLPEAWDIQTGDSNIIVSIHDGGIDHAHVDLNDNMWVNNAEISGVTGVDDDGNGYVDDIYGYNFVQDRGQIVPDPDGHGTHVAGTVAAVNNNGLGVSGVAGGDGSGNGIRLMSAQVFTSFGAGFGESYVYAADNGAVISQNSWGYTSPGVFEASVKDGIDYFIANAGYDAGGAPVGPMQGGLVIFSSGNANSSADYYPGFYSPILAVASTNHRDQKAWYSNFGSWVDIAAPGGETSITREGVLSTLPGNTYGFFQGTSMACPHVSGAAALIVSEYQGTGLTPAVVRSRLTETTDDIDADNPGFIGQLGAGRLNAFNALLRDDMIPPEPVTDLTASAVFFDKIFLQWTAPADSDNVNASFYEVRAAAFPLNDSNFDSAALVVTSLPASEAGSTESYELEGLVSDSTFYLALVARDFFGNSSPVSNVLNITTPAPPIVSVSPDSLFAELFIGDSIVELISMSNDGEGLLEVSLSFSGVAPTSGLSNYDSVEHVVQDLDQVPMTSKTVKIIPSLSSATDLSGQVIGFSTVETIIRDALVAKGAEVRSLPGNITSTVLSDMTILVFDDTGVGSLSSAEIALVRDWVQAGGGLLLAADDSFSMTYVNQLLSGTGIQEQSYGTYYDGNLTDIFPHPITNGVATVDSDGYGSYCIISGSAVNVMNDDFSNSHIAATNYASGRIVAAGNEVYYNFFLTAIGDNQTLAENIFDWLSGSGGWIDLPVDSLVIDEGESSDIEVVFNAKSVLPGDYNGFLLINTNDPVNATESIALSLKVNGASSISTIDSTNFSEVFITGTDSASFFVNNTGTDDLVITSVTISDPAFSTDLSAGTISAGDSTVYTIVFAPDSSRTYLATMEIMSNDPSDSVYTIILAGQGVKPPIFEFSPLAIEDSLFTGETSSHVIHLSNSGFSDLQVDFLLNGTGLSASPSVLENDFGDPSAKYESFALSGKADTRYRSSLPTSKAMMSSMIADSIVIFYDDMEVIGGWTSSAVVGGVNNWSNTTARSNSGLRSWNVAQHPGAGSDALTSPEYILPGLSSIFMSFATWYEFDDCASATFEPDGVIVEINDGTGWTKITPVDGYPYILDDICDNPIAFEEAYTHENLRFEIETFDVSDYAGKTVRIRFLAGWDCGNCDSNEGFYVDDLVFHQPFTWLQLSATNLTIPPGGSETIDVEINAEGLLGDTYEAQIIMQSNDPLNSEPFISVTLDVTGVPMVSVSEDTVNFNPLKIGLINRDTVELKNVGTDLLSVLSAEVADSSFNAFVLDSLISPTQSTGIVIEFRPGRDGFIADNVLITTDDPLNSITSIHVTGTGLLPPKFVVDTTEIVRKMFIGEQFTRIIALDNTGGGSELDYEFMLNPLYDEDSVEVGAVQANLPKTPEVNLSSENPPADLSGPVISGDHLRFSVDDFGEIMPYQYPIGNEHLQRGAYVSGFNVAYTSGSIPAVASAYFQGRSRLLSESYQVLENSSTRAEIEVVMRTIDSKIRITRNFEFFKNAKSIKIISTLENISGENLANVNFKTFADWDVDGDPSDDDWGFDSDLNMVYAYESTYHTIVGSQPFSKYDLNGWNDYSGGYDISVEATAPVSTYDGLEILQYNIGTLSSGSQQVFEHLFASASSFEELRSVVTEGLNFVDWIEVDKPSGTIPAGAKKFVQVTFDADGLEAGLYESTITINSSDPFNPNPGIPVTLKVCDGECTPIEVFPISGAPGDTVYISSFDLDVTTAAFVKFWDDLVEWGVRDSETLWAVVPSNAFGKAQFKANINGRNYRSNDFQTTSPEPLVPASGITALQRCDGVQIDWVKGDGSKELIVIKETSNPLDFVPEDTRAYNFSNEMLVRDEATNNYLVFRGRSNKVTVTGLPPGVQYTITIYSFNGFEEYSNYNLNAESIEFDTENFVIPTFQVSNPQVISIGSDSVRLSWNKGNGNKSLVILKEAVNPFDHFPERCQNYPANTEFKAGKYLNDNFVVYNGTRNFVDVTGLSPGITYKAYFYTFNKTSVGPVYMENGAELEFTTTGSGSSLMVIPNPFTKTAEVVFDGEINYPVEMQVFDLSGNLVQTKGANGPAGMNIGWGLKKGMYVLKLIEGGNTYERLIVKE